MNKLNEIKLEQKPVIRHKLKEVGERVTKRLNELNISGMVATNDNVKSLKKLRAELNGEFKDFEDQRKFIKNAVNEPYIEFEGEYKTEVSEKYKTAIELLKDKISFVEDELLKKKKESIERFFSEYCQSIEIDWLKFDKLNIDVLLSGSEKSYKDKIRESIERIANDVELITNLNDSPEEMLTEYKKCLDAGKSINTVRQRQELIRQEKKRAEIKESQRRFDKFEEIGMQFDDMLNVFAFNDQINVHIDKIKDLSPNDFDLLLVQFDENINRFKKQQLNSQGMGQNEAKREESIQTTAQTLNAPRELKKEEIEKVKAVFEVVDTYPRLKALGEYMKKNGYSYKNIK